MVEKQFIYVEKHLYSGILMNQGCTPTEGITLKF